MNRLKKNYIFPLTFLMILFFTIPLTSCDPHRSGNVSGQIGAKKGRKRHTSPASSKRVRKSKY
jgi:hypothetical protein